MTLGRLLRRNLLYHWRGNSAVFLGVAVGTAVLTGALLVGDSLRGSLRDLVLDQLGWVDQALVAGRFFREDLAAKLDAPRACPAILLRGTATRTNEAGQMQARAGQVTILGVDERFWPAQPIPLDREFWQSTARDVVLNQALAAELQVRPGDEVKLYWQKAGAVPRESFLGRRGALEVVNGEKLTVRAVLSDDGLSRFNLNPSAEPARNAFVPLRALQELVEQKGRANALLVGGDTEGLQEKLGHQLTELEDWGLVLRKPQTPDHTSRGYLSLESQQLLLEPAIVAAAQEAAKETRLQTAPTLVYLANNIAGGDRLVATAVAALDPAPPALVKPWILHWGPLQVPYSVVAALDPGLPPPLGPFLPEGTKALADDEVLLIDWEGWKDAGLDLRRDEPIALSYFQAAEQGRLQEVSRAFRLRGLLPLEGAANDPNLTPEFRGITDKLSIRDWKPPFPYDNRRVKPSRDEAYWNKHRATPKAYVNLTTGQQLWGSRFGQLTSIRLAPRRESLGQPTPDLTKAADEFQEALVKHLRPEEIGLVFDNVRKRGLEASAGGPDFNLYFPGFSAFLIISALLLVGLLFRLNLDRRGSEIGLLLAAGYRRRRVRRLLLAEGIILAATGGLVGLFGAFLYAWFLLELLRAWWPGTMDRSFLRLHAGPWSFPIGYAIILAVSVLTIFWAVRVLGKVSPKALLAGETTAPPPSGRTDSGPRWSLWLAGLAAAGALALVITGRYVTDHETQAMSFFGSGALWLTAGLAAAWAWMRRRRHGQVSGHGSLALARLGVRNAARHPARSLLTAGLLASAVFLVVAVESFHRGTAQEALDPHSGTGGFTLLAESNLPIYQDLNDDEKRIKELDFPDNSTAILNGVHFYGFRLRAGDDASCLNLYQANRPRLLGVPPALIRLNRFRIQPADQDDPWRLLEADAGGAIPAFADSTTAEFMLKKGLGDVVEVPDEQGRPVKLRLVGLVQDSIFQSQLLVSESNFFRLYPSHEGYNFYLIDAPPDRTDAITEVLETNLAERGFQVTPTARRLESYWAVENTYLATFQALGGLGVVLGALGLAVVLLRTVWERRGELALLRALGFRRSALSWLVLAENSFLLVLGLGVGTLTALLAVVPHLARTNGEVPVIRIGELLGLVLVVGLSAGALAVATSLRAPLVPALRRE